MRRSRTTSLGVLLAAGALALTVTAYGCGGDGGGEAPAISDLTYDAGDMITTTGGGMISGEFAFEDADGDVIELYIVVRAPDGTETPLDPDMLEGIEDAASGRINFNISLTSLSQAGTWEFGVWVRDAEGNDSGELTGTFEVTEEM